jgi:hypothetical protein
VTGPKFPVPLREGILEGLVRTGQIDGERVLMNRSSRTLFRERGFELLCVNLYLSSLEMISARRRRFCFNTARGWQVQISHGVRCGEVEDGSFRITSSRTFVPSRVCAVAGSISIIPVPSSSARALLLSTYLRGFGRPLNTPRLRPAATPST